MSQKKNTPLRSIDSVLRRFDILLEVLEKTRTKYKIEKSDKKNKNQKVSHLAICIDHAHEMFSKYYKLTDKTEAYVVAMVLDSRQKYKYFFTHWDEEHHEGVKEKTQALYNEFRNVVNDVSMNSQQNVKKRKVDDFDINDFRFEVNEDVQDELKWYLNLSKLTLFTQKANWSFDIMT